MMFEVQNGIVQSRKSTICHFSSWTWKARKYATVKPMRSVKTQVRNANLKVAK